MLLLGEQDFAASGHDSLDANRLVMVTLRQATRTRAVRTRRSRQAAKLSFADTASDWGRRSLNSASSASFTASSLFRCDWSKRHRQLPPCRLGVFIRASLPKPSTSCNGMMLRLAAEQSAAR